MGQSEARKMFIRVFTSIIAGLCVTAGLFYLMHYLIDTSDGAVDLRPRIILNSWVRTVDDTDIILDEDIPERIAPPVDLPQPLAETEPGETYTGVRASSRIQHPTTKFLTPSVFGYTDGALINIISVKPNYPVAASSRGLEGYVVVQFDVTSMGTVTNVVVIESSSRLFNKSAISAAKKFRFKPKVVDGTPQESYGLRRLFTFEMDEN